MKRSDAIAKRVLEKMGGELEAEYRRERLGAAERLYNAFAAAIGEQTPSLETLLYVVEMIRFDMLSQRHQALFGPGAQVTPPVAEEGKPSAIGFGVV